MVTGVSQKQQELHKSQVGGPSYMDMGPAGVGPNQITMEKLAPGGYHLELKHQQEQQERNKQQQQQQPPPGMYAMRNNMHPSMIQVQSQGQMPGGGGIVQGNPYMNRGPTNPSSQGPPPPQQPQGPPQPPPQMHYRTRY